MAVVAQNVLFKVELFSVYMNCVRRRKKVSSGVCFIVCRCVGIVLI